MSNETAEARPPFRGRRASSWWGRRRSDASEATTTAECVPAATIEPSLSVGQEASTDPGEQSSMGGEAASIDVESTVSGGLVDEESHPGDDAGADTGTTESDTGTTGAVETDSISPQPEAFAPADSHPDPPRSVSNGPGKRRWSWKLVVLLIVLVGIIAGVVVTVVVVTSDSDSRTSSATPPDGGPSNQSPENDQYFQQIRAELVPPPLWTDSSSSQIRAVEWMAYTDTSTRLLDDLPRLTQRYALLVVYFATGGENWDSVVQFEPGVHECDWSFVSCQNTASSPVSSFRVGSGFVAGVLPSEIGLLTQLTSLNVKDNRLKGSLPEELYGLTKMESLILTNNLFSSKLSTKIGNLDQLRTLHFDRNYITGFIPTTLARLSRLTSLDCTLTFVEGNIFDRIMPLTNLENAYFSNAQLWGSFPTEISKLSKLRIFAGQQTGISGTLPSEIGALPLAQLELFDTLMNGPIPESIGQLGPTLKNLALGRSISSSLPTTMGLLTRLESLFLSLNEVTGSIPTELGNMMSVDDILIAFNKLTGTVPSELGKLTNLLRLDLRKNLLTGDVPTEICELIEVHRLETLITSECETPKLNCTCCTSCHVGTSSGQRRS